MRKWYSVVLSQKEWSILRKLVEKHGIKFETSGYWKDVHVEFCLNESELVKVSRYLEGLEKYSYIL